MIHLQNRVQALERELIQISEDQREIQDAEALMRGAGLVRFKENDESRFLGPSSGINMTRLVMDLAKQNSNAESIKEIVPEKKAQQIRERFTKESSKPTSKVYPLISSVAAPTLPTRDLTQKLVENFNQKGGPLCKHSALFSVAYTLQLNTCYLSSMNLRLIRPFMTCTRDQRILTRILLFGW